MKRPREPDIVSQEQWLLHVEWEDPIWLEIEHGWRAGWTLREMATMLELPLSTIEQRVHTWLERRP